MFICSMRNRRDRERVRWACLNGKPNDDYQMAPHYYEQLAVPRTLQDQEKKKTVHRDLQHRANTLIRHWLLVLPSTRPSYRSRQGMALLPTRSNKFKQTKKMKKKKTIALFCFLRTADLGTLKPRLSGIFHPNRKFLMLIVEPRFATKEHRRYSRPPWPPRVWMEPLSGQLNSTDRQAPGTCMISMGPGAAYEARDPCHSRQLKLASIPDSSGLERLSWLRK